MRIIVHFSPEALKAYQLGLFGGETHIPETGRMPRRKKQQLTRVAITDAKGRSTHVWKATPKAKHEPPKMHEAPKPPQDPAGHHAAALVDLLKKHGRGGLNPHVRQSRSGKYSVHLDNGSSVIIGSDGTATVDDAAASEHYSKAIARSRLNGWFGMRTYEAPMKEWADGHAERIRMANAGHQIPLPPRPAPITDEDRESARAGQALSDAMRRRRTGPRLLPGQTHTPNRAGG